MHKENKLIKNRKKFRKNYLHSIIVTFLILILLFLIIIFLSPDYFFNIFIFLVLFFLLMFFIFGILTASSKVGFLISLAITLYMIIRYFGSGNIFQLAIIFAIVLIYYYFSRKKE